MSDIENRITDYLFSGGMLNPELAIHDRVRDLLIDCRDEITRLRADVERLRLTDAEREAVKWSIAECEREAVIERSRAQTRNYLDCQLRECQAMSRASTLRDLLARLGGAT